MQWDQRSDEGHWVEECSHCLLSNVNMVDGMMMVQFGACVDINADMVMIVAG